MRIKIHLINSTAIETNIDLTFSQFIESTVLNWRNEKFINLLGHNETSINPNHIVYIENLDKK
jgi:hypothetical protein